MRYFAKSTTSALIVLVALLAPLLAGASAAQAQEATNCSVQYAPGANADEVVISYAYDVDFVQSPAWSFTITSPTGDEIGTQTVPAGTVTAVPVKMDGWDLGTYIVEADGDAGACSTAINLVSLAERLQNNLPPTVQADCGPSTAYVGDVVTLVGSASDPDGYIYQEASKWRLPDGSDVAGSERTYSFEEPGDFTFAFFASDDLGVEAAQTCGVSVTVAPPVEPEPEASDADADATDDAEAEADGSAAGEPEADDESEAVTTETDETEAAVEAEPTAEEEEEEAQEGEGDSENTPEPTNTAETTPEADVDDDTSTPASTNDDAEPDVDESATAIEADDDQSDGEADGELDASGSDASETDDSGSGAWMWLALLLLPLGLIWWMRSRSRKTRTTESA